MTKKNEKVKNKRQILNHLYAQGNRISRADDLKFRTVCSLALAQVLVRVLNRKVWHSRITCSGQNKNLVRLESSELCSEIMQPHLGFVKDRLRNDCEP